jgi:hypothetical protein
MLQNGGKYEKKIDGEMAVHCTGVILAGGRHGHICCLCGESPQTQHIFGEGASGSDKKGHGEK